MIFIPLIISRSWIADLPETVDRPTSQTAPRTLKGTHLWLAALEEASEH